MTARVLDMTVSVVLTSNPKPVMSVNESESIGFFTLPLEIHLEIYKYVFHRGIVHVYSARPDYELPYSIQPVIHNYLL